MTPVIQLVEPAAVLLKYDHMAVAITGFGVAFDQRRGWYRHRPGIALVAESAQPDAHLALRASNDLVRDTDTLARVGARVEIRMQRIRTADVIDNVGRIRVHGCAGNIHVPEALGREGHKPVQRSESAGRHRTAGLSYRNRARRSQRDDQRKRGNAISR